MDKKREAGFVLMKLEEKGISPARNMRCKDFRSAMVVGDRKLGLAIKLFI